MEEQDFVIEKKKLIRYTGSAERVEVPQGVTAIGEGVFARKNVREVILPDTVTRIGREAFAWSRLETIRMPAKLKTISDRAFASTPLRRIEIPAGVVKIGWEVFSGCMELEAVGLPEGLQKIDGSAFQNCRSLVKIDLDHVTEIADGAFSMCDGLADENGFVVIRGTLHKSIGIYRAQHITLPATVRRVGSFAFNTLDGVGRRGRFCTSIVVPETVEELGYSAFASCTVLEEITLPDHLKEIPGGCFYGCNRLKKVRMNPDTRFEARAFENSGFEAEAKRLCAPAPAPVRPAPMPSAEELALQQEREWMESYGHCLESAPRIEFAGKTFVLAGILQMEFERGVVIEKEIIARGGIIRRDVTGKTDYLVVYPKWALGGKVKAALAQQAKGKPVRVVLGDDVLKAFED